MVVVLVRKVINFEFVFIALLGLVKLDADVSAS